MRRRSGRDSCAIYNHSLGGGRLAKTSCCASCEIGASDSQNCPAADRTSIRTNCSDRCAGAGSGRRCSRKRPDRAAGNDVRHGLPNDPPVIRRARRQIGNFVGFECGWGRVSGDHIGSQKRRIRGSAKVNVISLPPRAAVPRERKA